MWDAILWDQQSETRIIETRVKKLTPLLDQFRILNSFQPEVAREVTEQTRLRQAEILRERRAGVQDDLNLIEEDLLQYVQQRSEEVRESFDSLEKQVNKAESLVQQMTPRVETVAGKLLKQPQEWFQFVSDVLQAHRQVTKEPIEAYDSLQSIRGQFSKQLLKTLIPRGHNLAKYCESQQAYFDKLLTKLDHTQQQSSEKILQIKEIAERVSRLIYEVRLTHHKLDVRLKEIRKKQKQANQLQSEIDTIEGQEKQVNKRLGKLEEWHSAIQIKKSKLDKQELELQAQERTVAQKSLDLSRLEGEIQRKLETAVKQIKHLEANWSTYRTQKEDVDKALARLDQQVDILAAHERAVEMWAERYGDWVASLEERHEEVQDKLMKPPS